MKKITMVTGVLWIGAFVGAFVAFTVTEPTGDGFVRGLNRVGTFLGFQLGAMLLAVPLWIQSRSSTGAVRWLLKIPGILALMLLAGILILILWANY